MDKNNKIDLNIDIDKIKNYDDYIVVRFELF